jgi:hypothetical protein
MTYIAGHRPSDIKRAGPASLSKAYPTALARSAKACASVAGLAYNTPRSVISPLTSAT